MKLTPKTAVRTLFRCHNRVSKFFFFIIFVFLMFCGCVGLPPNEEYAMASVAIEAAKMAGAPKVATGYWNRALTAFREGEAYFEQKDYSAAQLAFMKARKYAERAENSARLQRLRSGEVF